MKPSFNIAPIGMLHVARQAQYHTVAFRVTGIWGVVEIEESLHNVVWNEDEAETGMRVQMDNRGYCRDVYAHRQRDGGLG